MNLERRNVIRALALAPFTTSANAQVGLFTLMPGLERTPTREGPSPLGGAVDARELARLDRTARPTQAGLPDTRGVWLINPQTREEIATVFFAGGTDQNNGYTLACRMLRDWRTAETVPVDPILLHMLWHVQRRTGFSEPLLIRTGYCGGAGSPEILNEDATSQKHHRSATACDFTIAGLSAEDIERSAHVFGTGGVGRYAGYTHIDTGPLRSWIG
jgi:uncharacterized protein YcbK (DUF882 family)